MEAAVVKVAVGWAAVVALEMASMGETTGRAQAGGVAAKAVGSVEAAVVAAAAAPAVARLMSGVGRHQRGTERLIDFLRHQDDQPFIRLAPVCMQNTAISTHALARTPVRTARPPRRRLCNMNTQ